MKIASIADVKAHLSAYVKASEEELVVITKNGKPVAVLLPMDDDGGLVNRCANRSQAATSQGRSWTRTPLTYSAP